jgi:hypothetical protein
MKTRLLAALVLVLAGCATQGGGILVPSGIGNIVGKNVLVGIAPVLSDQSVHHCNATAYEEYNASTLICEGKLTASIPISFGGVVQAVQGLCQIRGYTNSSNQLIVPETAAFGGCPATLAVTIPRAK